MLAMAAADLISKKIIGSDDLVPIKLRIIVLAVSFVLGLLMYIFGIGESGIAPWTLLIKHPILLADACCIVLSEFFYMFCLRYIGMSIMEAISSLESIVIFIGLIIINLVTGRLGAIKDMLMPSRLVFVLIILIATTLLPNIESFASRKSAINDEEKRKKTYTLLGILLALLAVLFACGDTLIADTLLDSGEIKALDMTMTVFFFQIFMVPFFCFAWLKMDKEIMTSFKTVNWYYVAYVILYVVNICLGILGILAIAYDAVRSQVMFMTFPVIAILGARIVLKEKYSWGECICIWVITLAAIGFCMIDYVK